MSKQYEADSFIKTDGTSSQYLMADGTTSTGPDTGVDVGTGTANKVAKFSDSDTITDSTITDDGTNVGIGTASPSNKLEIALSGSGTSRERVLISSASAGQPGIGYPMLELNQAASSGNSRLIEAYTGGTLRFSLDNDGDLYASNSVAAGNLIMAYSTTESTITNVANEGIKFRSTHSDPNRANVTMGFGGWSSTERVVGSNKDRDDLLIRRNLDGDSTYSSEGSLLRLEKNVINTTSEDVNIIEWADDTLGELGVITGDGSVGIGTSSPSKKLEVATDTAGDGISGVTNTGVVWANIVNTNSNTFPVGKLTLRYGTNETASIAALNNEMRLGSSQTKMSFYTSSGEKMRIHSDGNVGIGTTSPSVTLDVASDNPKIRLTDTDGGIAALEGNLGNLILIADNGNTEADSRVAFKVDGSEKMRIDSSGNVGIGTTSPDSPLHISETDTNYDVARGVHVEITKDHTNETGWGASLFGVRSTVQNDGVGKLTDLQAGRFQAEHIGTGVSYYLLGSQSKGIHNGSGNTGVIWGAFNAGQIIGTGTGTHPFLIGANQKAELDNANASVTSMAGTISAAKTTAGDVTGRIDGAWIELDCNQGAATTVDASVLFLKADTGSLTASGTIRTIYSTSTHPSEFAGSIEATEFIVTGGTATEFVMADGSIEEASSLELVSSSTSGEPTGSDAVLNIVSLTQAEYDAGTPVSSTLYIITDA